MLEGNVTTWLACVCGGLSGGGCCPGTCLVHFTTSLLPPGSVYPGPCPCVRLLPIHCLQLKPAFLHVCTASSTHSVLLALPVYGSSRALAHASSQPMPSRYLCLALQQRLCMLVAPLRVLSALLSVCVCVCVVWQGDVCDGGRCSGRQPGPLPAPLLGCASSSCAGRHRIVLWAGDVLELMRSPPLGSWVPLLWSRKVT